MTPIKISIIGIIGSGGRMRQVIKTLVIILTFSTSAVFSADLDGVNGKIFKVNPTTKSFELLKETVFDPKTDEGKSRHQVEWTNKTKFTKVLHQRNFKNLPNSIIVEILVDGTRQKNPPESATPWNLVFARFYPELKTPDELASTNLVGRFSPAIDNPSKGTITINGKAIPTIISRRPRRDYVIHSTLTPKTLANGFWNVTLHGAMTNDQFVLTSMTASPQPDPRDTDNPKLPRVLVVGDSISMNYHNAAKTALKDIANYHRVEGNGGPSDRGVNNMELWLGDYKTTGLHWDLIQFNHGLHDLKQAYDKDTGTWGAHQVSIPDYQANLEKEIQIMKKTGATLMWCATTPIPLDSKGPYARRNGESAIFNRAALEVVKKHPDILINDLHGFISNSSDFDKWRTQTDVHFWDGTLQAVVGDKVAASVKQALLKKTKPTKRTFASIQQTLQPDKVVSYKTIGDRSLTLHFFHPQGFKPSDKRPAFVAIHGGGWSGGTPRRFYPYANALVDRGYVGISVEYRLVSQKGVTVFDCVKDGRSAIRYIRAHAKELGIDPNKITVSGGSAGGHVAAGTALFNNTDHKDEDLSISCTPNALVLLFPVIDTSDKGYGQKKIGENWKTISPAHQVNGKAPPTLIFHGDADRTTPYAGAKLFTENMLKAGNTCELITHPGGGHGHINQNMNLFDDAVKRTAKFLEAQNLAH